MQHLHSHLLCSLFNFVHLFLPACYLISSLGMCNFQQQNVRLPQFFPQQPSQYVPVSGMQPGGHIRSLIGGQFSGETQQQLGYSQPQYGIQHPSPSQPHYTSPQQQQSYLPLPSGQFTGETQGA